jgi:hypothetical protein
MGPVVDSTLLALACTAAAVALVVAVVAVAVMLIHYSMLARCTRNN